MYCVEPIRDVKKISQIKSILKKRGTRNLLLFIFGIKLKNIQVSKSARFPRKHARRC